MTNLNDIQLQALKTLKAKLGKNVLTNYNHGSLVAISSNGQKFEVSYDFPSDYDDEPCYILENNKMRLAIENVKTVVSLINRGVTF